ncbi:MAG: DUF4838 domain-containing protein [Planctomycetaceae bacterium]
MKHTFSLFFVLLLAPLEAGYATERFIVKNGEPQAEIVIAEDPARMTKLAARELQIHLVKMSGAKLPIVTKRHKEKVAIYVGRSRLTDALGLATEGLKHGAFRMVSGPDWLAFLGPDQDFVPTEPWGRSRSREETARVNGEWDKITSDNLWNPARDLHFRYHPDLDVWDQDDAGTFNAVTEFLRGLGCRWFAPGELGEVIPRKQTILLPDVNRTVTPDFAVRRFVYYTEHTGIGDKALWNLRLGLNHGTEIVGFPQICHGMKFVIKREEMKRAHPEMYLLRNGQRDTTHKEDGVPNLLSPMVFDKQVKYARAMFDHFHEPMLNIDLVDGYGGLTSDDPAWMAQLTPARGWNGSMSDHVWGYLNRVALELYRSHPDRLVSALAYSAYTLPPENIAQMSPNLALIETRHRQDFWDEALWNERRALRAEWLKKLPSRKYITWDYSTNSRPDQVGRPVYYTRQTARDLKELKGVSLGEQIEIYTHPAGKESAFGYDELAVEHLNLYLAARFYWDVDQDVNAILDDYFHSYYGTAAEAMRDFVTHAEENWMLMSTDASKIGESLALLAKAQAAADRQSLPGRRIAQIAALMQPMHALQQQLSRKRETDASYRVLLTDQTDGKPMKTKPLDGKIDPAWWGTYRVAPLLPLTPNSPQSRASSRFQVLREGNVLYFGITCEEPDMQGNHITTTKNDDPNLLSGDHILLLIETPTRSQYEIAINPAGAVYDVDLAPGGRGVVWSNGGQVAVHRSEDRWSIELRLPIVGEDAFTLDPTQGIAGAQPKELFPWHFNLGRLRIRDSKSERTAFSPTGRDDFRVPEKFGKLWGK